LLELYKFCLNIFILFFHPNVFKQDINTAKDIAIQPKYYKVNNLLD